MAPFQSDKPRIFSRELRAPLRDAHGSMNLDVRLREPSFPQALQIIPDFATRTRANCPPRRKHPLSSNTRVTEMSRCILLPKTSNWRRKIALFDSRGCGRHNCMYVNPAEVRAARQAEPGSTDGAKIYFCYRRCCFLTR